MPLSRLLLFVVVIASMCTYTWGLYEEQAGQMDWSQENLGRVKFAVFQPRQKRKTVYVGTEQGVIASVNIRTGQPNWRQVLPDDETLDFLLLHQKLLITLSEGGAIARAWNTTDGQLRWDSGSYDAVSHAQRLLSRSGNGTATARAVSQFLSLSTQLRHAKETALRKRISWGFREFDVIIHHDETFNQVIVLNRDTVTAVDSTTGQAAWRMTVPPAQAGVVTFHRLWVDESTSRVLVLASSSLSRSLMVYALDASSGVQQGEPKSLSQSVPPSASNTVSLSTGVVIQLDKENLMCWSLKNAGAPTTTTTLKALLTKFDVYNFNAVQDVGVADLQLKSTFLLNTPQFRATVFIAGNLQLQVVDAPVRVPQGSTIASCGAWEQDEQGGAPVSKRKEKGKPAVAASDETDGKELDQPITDAFVIHMLFDKSKEQLSLVIHHADPFEKASSLPPLIPHVDFVNHGGVAQMFASPFTKATGGVAFRTLIVAQDISLSMLQGDQLMWTRDEALATIKQVEFVQLPADSTFAATQEYPSLLNRLGPQLQDLLASAKSLLAFRGVFSARKMDTTRLVADDFGFRKLILAVTEGGKVYALDSLQGNIVWEAIFRDQQTGSVEDIWRLQCYKEHSDCLVFSTTLSITPTTTIRRLNGLTGAVDLSSTVILPHQLLEAIQLPYRDTHHHALHMLVDTQFKVTVYPNDDEAMSLFDKHVHNVYFHLASVSDGNVKGYAVKRQASGEYRAVLVWTVDFPKEIESIAAVAAKPNNEVIQSSIRTIGETLMYKYLNPHLLTVATVRTQPVAGMRLLPGKKTATDPSVNVYLIDTVTGSILERVIHRYGEGPVHLLQSENVVVCHFWDTQQYQFEMSVLELFEERDPSDSGDVSELTSFSLPPLHLIQQTYVFRTGIKALSVSETQAGITSKHFLVGMVSDQVYGLNRRFVDAKRPTEAITQTEREEGLIPYMRELPVDPLEMLSYNKTVAGLRGIASSSAFLESTSLVFSYGVDMFFTRVAPSQTFDMLNEDFNYLFLIGTVTLVLVGIFVTGRLSKGAEVRAAWR